MTADENWTSPVRAKDGEPWVELPGAAELASWTREDQIRYNQQNRQMAKHAFYVAAFDFLHGNDVAGDYFEFGCHRARTFRMALTEARRQNLTDMRFFAFDSFAGLPECDPAKVGTSTWTTGALRTGQDEFMELIRAHGLFVDQVRTVPGFYDASLTPALQGELLASGRRPALVCVDCDLYESAASVFAFLEPLLQPGTLIYIDDMFAGYKGSPLHGVYKAFGEAAARSAWHFEPHMQVGWVARSFVTCKKD
jgi:hypothetical protein